MGWLLELLFGAINEMCSQFIVDMMDLASGMFTEILSCDLNLFEDLFGVVGDLYRNAVVPMAVMLLLMILVWQLFKSMFGRLGTSSEDPVELVFRSGFCLFLILFAKDIVNYVLEIAGTPYDWVVGTEIEVQSFSQYVSVAEGVMSALGTDALSISILKLILQFVIAWNYFKMLFILSERYVLLGIFSYTSPLAFATGGSKATNNVMASWTKMFGGQVVIVILDAWCVKMFLSAYGNMMASSYGFTKFFATNLCLIGFCKITVKLDSYMGSLGVNLGRIGGGMSGLGALLMAGRLLNFGGGRKGSTDGNGGSGPMNFGSGRPIPMKPGPAGSGGGIMSGNTGNSGSSIPGMGKGTFGEAGTKPVESDKKPWEDDGFGAFDMDAENGAVQSMPFGMPDEDAETGKMDQGGMAAFGEDGAENGVFDSAADWQSMEENPEFAGENGGDLPFGSETGYGTGGDTMAYTDGEEFTGLQEMDMQPDGMTSEALEEGPGISGMDSETGEMDMGYGYNDAGGAFGDADEGVYGGLPDFEDAQSGFDSAGLGTGESVVAADEVSEMSGTAGIAGVSEAAGIDGVARAGGISERDSAGANGGGRTGMDAEERNGGMAASGFRGDSGVTARAGISSESSPAGEHSLLGGKTFHAGNVGQTGFQTQAGAGAVDRATGTTGAYLAERDGEKYMRYDASRYEKPQGAYQTIHENGKTYYELPEGEKAPPVLPEIRVALEKDGTIRLEQVYRERQTEPMKGAEPGKEVQRLAEAPVQENPVAAPIQGNPAARTDTAKNQMAGNRIPGRGQKTDSNAGKERPSRKAGRRKGRKDGGA